MKVKENVKLASYTTFGIGGEARILVEPKSIEELKEAIEKAEIDGLPYFILGGGSNVLFPDKGFEGVIIRMAGLSWVEVDGQRIKAGAGTVLARLLKIAMENGLSGLEPLVGIPGQVGGAVFMNAGTREREMVELLEWVKVLTFTGSLERLTPRELGFGYRKSRISDVGVVVEVSLKLAESSVEVVRQEMDRLLEKRKATQPYGEKSAGCIFKNPEKNLSAGFLLDKAGLKGFRIGGAEYSRKHANFIINRDNASAEDVLHLIRIGKQKVREQFGYELEEEIVIVRNGGM